MKSRTRPFLLWIAAWTAAGIAIVTVPWVNRDLFNWIAFGSMAEPAGIGPAARDYLHLSFCILGALMTGFGVAMWFLARCALAHGELWAWQAIAASLVVWFVLDTTASIAVGFERNAALNIILALPGAIALWWARPVPHRRSA
jgi:hypothetical protein